MSGIFEEPNLAPQPRYWFYATVALAIIITLSGALYLAHRYGLISRLIEGEMKIDGEIFIVTQGRGNVKLGLVEVCAIPEKEMLDWIDSKQTRARFESENTKKLVAQAEKDKKLADQDLQNARAGLGRLREIYFDDILNSAKEAAYNQASSLVARKAGILDDKETTLNSARNRDRAWSSPAYYFDGLKGCEAVSKTNSDGKFQLRLKSKKYALAAKSDRKIFDGTEEYFWLIWVSPESLPSEPLMLSNDNLMTTNPTTRVVAIGQAKL